MNVFRRLVAVVLLFTCAPAFAYGDDTGEQLRAKTSEYGDKFVSIWGPLGFTIGGAAATVGGGAFTLLGVGLVANANSYGHASAGEYAVLGAGSAVLAAGLVLLTVGIVKLVLRSQRLRAQYGD
ncbi:MAG: hypothetical protein IPJ65_39945 [Archangiaceae bacterium]|nr:hypothetical protein [Archangiaceae bacterium]